MPIKNRTDMPTTGIRTRVGIKVFGSDLKQIEAVGKQLEGLLQSVPGTRSVYGERVAGGYFIDFDLKRKEISRYGLSIKEVQEVIMSAIGGENVSTTPEGRERYPINVRYPRELRDDVMKRIAAPMIGGLFTSFLMELLVYPAIYLLWKWREVRKAAEVPTPTLAAAALEG